MDVELADEAAKDADDQARQGEEWREEYDPDELRVEWKRWTKGRISAKKSQRRRFGRLMSVP